MPGMISLTELKTAFDVSANTIRNWSSEYAPYLSAAANPPTGERRRFTAEDAAALALVATMRADDKPLEIIRAHLDAGERGTWPPGGYDAAQDRHGGAQSGTMMQLSDQGENIALRAKNELLERELEHYRNRSEELHARAIAAETKLMLLGDGENVETHETAVSAPTESAGEDTAVSWLSRLRRAWRGE
jgi:DNA-binding transcriptional MerR regulator